MEFKLEDVDIHVVDQRIGVGVGGFYNRIRFYHKPTQILLELTGKGSWETRQRGLNVLQLLVEETP